MIRFIVNKLIVPVVLSAVCINQLLSLEIDIRRLDIKSTPHTFSTKEAEKLGFTQDEELVLYQNQTYQLTVVSKKSDVQHKFKFAPLTIQKLDSLLSQIQAFIQDKLDETKLNLKHTNKANTGFPDLQIDLKEITPEYIPLSARAHPLAMRYWFYLKTLTEFNRMKPDLEKQAMIASDSENRRIYFLGPEKPNDGRTIYALLVGEKIMKMLAHLH
jgi:hypothetical protein